MKSIFAISAVLMLAASAASGAAEWPNIPASPSGEATVWDPDPQWPRLGASAVKEKDRAWEAESRWPIKPVAAEETTGSIGGAAWPAIAPPSAISAFAFEVGARYWYSNGKVRFAFRNGDPWFGDPTSTLDWSHARGHSGEVFGRLDHRPTGVFVKGVIGAGALHGGSIIDRDFFVTQLEFSDTSSYVTGDGVHFGMVDLGWGFEVPGAGVRLGGFVGYHYWREKMSASGVICNPDDVYGFFCGPPGVAVVGSTVPVFEYEPSWHALRVGLDARFQITPAWSFAGEVAFVPYAHLENKDSHLLRQDMSDLGPAPNVIARSKHGWGAEIEAFVNYAILPQVEIGVGGRYWALATGRGGVRFGPDFLADYDLTRFEHQRFGLLVQVKGRF